MIKPPDKAICTNSVLCMIVYGALDCDRVWVGRVNLEEGSGAGTLQMVSRKKSAITVCILLRTKSFWQKLIWLRRMKNRDLCEGTNPLPIFLFNRWRELSSRRKKEEKTVATLVKKEIDLLIKPKRKEKVRFID